MFLFSKLIHFQNKQTIMQNKKILIIHILIIHSKYSNSSSWIEFSNLINIHIKYTYLHRLKNKLREKLHIL